MSVRSNNSIYRQKIEKYLRQRTHKALAWSIATVYYTALKETYQDSGQAAWNWQVLYREGDKERRAQLVRGKGTTVVGARGEKRTDTGSARAVISEKLRMEGMAPSGPRMNSAFVRQFSRRPGRLGHARVYNPLYDRKTYGEYVSRAFERAGGRRAVSDSIRLALARAIRRFNAS